MKKTLALFAFATLLCSQAFALYIIVLKDGTRYKAKARWTVSNGKAIVTLENGQTLALNLNEIDVAKSEEVAKLGLGDVQILGTEQQSQTQQQKQAPSLGSVARIRKQPAPGAAPVTPVGSPGATAPAAPAPVADQLDTRVKETFERAYENGGIYEHKLSGTNRNVRVELTADNEDKVFNAISATAFLVARNAGLTGGQQIDMVELFMKTTNGGAAGRFMINRTDADAINNKTMTLQDYFVRKVLY